MPKLLNATDFQVKFTMLIQAFAQSFSKSTLDGVGHCFRQHVDYILLVGLALFVNLTQHVIICTPCKDMSVKLGLWKCLPCQRNGENILSLTSFLCSKIHFAKH